MEIHLNTFLERTFLTKKEAAQEFLELFLNCTNSDFGYFHFINDNDDEFEQTIWSKTVIAKTENIHAEISYKFDNGPWAESLKSKKLSLLTKVELDQHNQYVPHSLGQVAEYISLPIIVDSKVFAIVGAASSQHYNNELIASLTKFMRKHGKALKLKFDSAEDHYLALRNDFQNLSNDTVLVEMLLAISNALELRDAYTTHHQKNVSHISECIAVQLELNQERVFGLRVGALIHDLGKITIPSQLLNKSGKIEKAEYDYLKLHAKKGAYILKDAHFPWPIQKMIEQHHERLDGSGYPYGLKENEIILEAKIIAVADTFDAMANDRPYRKRPGIAKAISTLQGGRMTKYDPYVLDAFMTCFNRDNSFGGRYKPDE